MPSVWESSTSVFGTVLSHSATLGDGEEVTLKGQGARQKIPEARGRPGSNSALSAVAGESSLSNGIQSGLWEKVGVWGITKVELRGCRNSPWSVCQFVPATKSLTETTGSTILCQIGHQVHLSR